MQLSYVFETKKTNENLRPSHYIQSVLRAPKLKTRLLHETSGTPSNPKMS